jgi:valyl-tRNA synthetase
MPLEIITTRQWYISNGSRDQQLRSSLLARGRELSWHPPHMRTRYEHWVAGLTGDWLISRQRYRGVPIPVWYPLDATGQPLRDQPILPGEAALPLDPATDAPPGYREDQRGEPGGFAADPDVMDTWATSSLTPQIAAGWLTPDDLSAQVFPMDLRPQAHEIIRTWLFYTVLRAQTEAGVLPWQHVAISGWILDPDRKKMSKSKGNAVTPVELLDNYGTDAVRYWAASARLGVDATFDEAQLKIGRRLAIKLLNAGKFVLGFPAAQAGPAITAPLDLAMLRRLAAVTQECTEAMEAYDHAAALEHAERCFWLFCDDYLELVKARAYGEYGPDEAGSAVTTLRTGLGTLLRLLAPVLPFVTEEVWSWWQDGSIHRAPWPDAAALGALAGHGDDQALTVATSAIAAVRKAKSQAQLAMKHPVALLKVTAGQEVLAGLDATRGDVLAAAKAAGLELVLAERTEPRYEVVLAERVARAQPG